MYPFVPEEVIQVDFEKITEERIVEGTLSYKVFLSIYSTIYFMAVFLLIIEKFQDVCFRVQAYSLSIA